MDADTRDRLAAAVTAMTDGQALGVLSIYSDVQRNHQVKIIQSRGYLRLEAPSDHDPAPPGQLTETDHARLRELGFQEPDEERNLPFWHQPAPTTVCYAVEILAVGLETL